MLLGSSRAPAAEGDLRDVLFLGAGGPLWSGERGQENAGRLPGRQKAGVHGVRVLIPYFQVFYLCWFNLELLFVVH